MSILTRFLEFLDARPQAPQTAHGFDRVQIAAAALLIELARQDTSFDEDERQTIVRIVRERFELSDQDADALIDQAAHEQEEAWDDWMFREKIRSGFPPEDRVNIVEMLWEVAYADSSLDPFEASLIGRIAESIGVNRDETKAAQDRISAKAST